MPDGQRPIGESIGESIGHTGGITAPDSLLFALRSLVSRFGAGFLVCSELAGGRQLFDPKPLNDTNRISQRTRSERSSHSCARMLWHTIEKIHYQAGQPTRLPKLMMMCEQAYCVHVFRLFGPAIRRTRPAGL